MGMELVWKFSVGVVHVLTGVDVEVLLLHVTDLERVVLDAVLVLSEESSDNWVAVVTLVLHHGLMEQVGHTQELRELPAESWRSAVLESLDELKGQASTEEPGNTVVSVMGQVQTAESVSIDNWKVVGQKVALLAFVVREGVEPVEAVFFDPEFSEPRSSWDLSEVWEVILWWDALHVF